MLPRDEVDLAAIDRFPNEAARDVAPMVALSGGVPCLAVRFEKPNTEMA
ncbi:hypothetical protein Achl_1084 [Pseudarthrobacter chlorophenolicus A6]|uniref:Uncharacterized protein n=1 Tax=Pseudarthrobacter chlorophenolicus (strain ATCC 700700 / DSM 12829 / CIP 107037 / JCM 12360 / KCTC 9906 / NCIMB 13794 / A6) TaxID=452863 RepID=B8HE43_PSECP|nr:hypothetical protein Achl_1084 [Pseudarthrobacter chlorophenolicus A6]